jgi:hypothetical protein
VIVCQSSTFAVKRRRESVFVATMTASLEVREALMV